MNKFFIFIIVMFTTQIYCQSKLINDLTFSNLVGKPKIISEITISQGNIVNKNIAYYNIDGYLKKVEHYNLTRSKFPNERFLNEITEYDFNDKKKRKFKTINVENNEIVLEGTFEKVADSIYKKSSISKVSQLEKTFYFNDDNKLFKTEENGNFFNSKIENTLFYFYLNNQYDYIIAEDISKNKIKVFYKNSKLDKNGNLIYYELVDEKGNQIENIERKIEYY